MKEVNNNLITIGEIVALDYRAASVFKDAEIDFCCGGEKSLEDDLHIHLHLENSIIFPKTLKSAN
jgi:iron-sulfur cluster repair protein YtfE (RIC family)